MVIYTIYVLTLQNYKLNLYVTLNYDTITCLFYLKDNTKALLMLAGCKNTRNIDLEYIVVSIGDLHRT